MQINDAVIHPGQGVCRITDIREEDFAGEKQLYYVLEPVYAKKGTTLFVPAEGNKVQLRKILKKSEIEALIEEAVSSPDTDWNSNDKMRQREFMQTLKQGSHIEIMKMIASIRMHKKSLYGSGKKLHSGDEHIMENAEHLLHQEFAFSLGLKPEEVGAYIIKQIEKIK